MTTVHIEEAQYVDPRSGNDKFYRTYRFGATWLTQYGRNGTAGTFTKPVEAATEIEAAAAAAKKLTSKVKKGYEPVRSGSVAVTQTATEGILPLLDQLAQGLPAGTTTGIITAPVEAVELAERAADLTAMAVAALTEQSNHHASPASPEDLAPSLPVRPMLASVQPDDAVAGFMEDDDWVAQFKYDGDRVVIEVDQGQIRVLNRQGEQKTRNVVPAHLKPFSALHTGRWVFDGEVVGRTLVLFDLITTTDGVTTFSREQTPFAARFEVLEVLSRVLGIPAVGAASETSAVVLAPVATGTQAKGAMLEQAISQQREGIILRMSAGLYESGRRAPVLVKHKLIKDADVVVTAVHDSKQSVELSVYSPNGEQIVVGAASTIGKTDSAGGAPALNQVWVVTFLYVTDPQHPRMVQPRLIRHRTDKAPADCLLDQFAHAGTNITV